MNNIVNTEVIIYTEIKEYFTLEALTNSVPKEILRLNDYDMKAALKEQNSEPIFMGIEYGFLIAMRRDDFNYILTDNEDGTITHRLYREVDNITFLTILQYAFCFTPEK